MTSQKCCCPAVNGWRRLRLLVGELAISWKIILLESRRPKCVYFIILNLESVGNFTSRFLVVSSPPSPGSQAALRQELGQLKARQ